MQAKQTVAAEKRATEECNVLRREAGDTWHELEHTTCVRQHTSFACYQEIYGADTVCSLVLFLVLPLTQPHLQLEEGEVDFRYTSFRGCVSKEISARNREQRGQQ